jgi:hypothetical protein
LSSKPLVLPNRQATTTSTTDRALRRIRRKNAALFPQLRLHDLICAQPTSSVVLRKLNLYTHCSRFYASAIAAIQVADPQQRAENSRRAFP